MVCVSVDSTGWQVRCAMEGRWPGAKLESDESLAGASDGVTKSRDFRTKPEDGGRPMEQGRLQQVLGSAVGAISRSQGRFGAEIPRCD